MVTHFHQVRNLEDLRRYVNQTICERYQLQSDAFPLTQRILRRRGRPCGIYFCLHGPRAARFTAIWETESNCILFYGADGERFQKTQLLEGPDLEAFQPCSLAPAAA